MAAAAPACLAGTTELISVGPKRVQAKSLAAAPTVSTDGRFVAFESFADNLVRGDTNDEVDIFLRDRVHNSTQRVSIADDGTEADGSSSAGIVVGTGRFIGFSSAATNLVAGDTNRKVDGFVRDRSLGRTIRVSVSSKGVQGNADSYLWALTPSGRYAALVSDAGNLVPNDTNAAPDVFIRDLVDGKTTRASVGPSGRQADAGSWSAALSENGRFVAFESEATNLVAGNTNRAVDVFVRDLLKGTTERVSLTAGGKQANGASHGPTISADGRFVAFWSVATNLVPGGTVAYPNVFLRDRKLGTTRWLSSPVAGGRGDGGSWTPKISADGRFVAFDSSDSTLVRGDTNETNDVFIRNVAAATTKRMSVGANGVQGNGSSERAAISADGRYVAFDSEATNLVPNDRNGVRDVFMRDRN